MIKKLFKFASLLLSSVALYASGPALNIDSGTITNLTTKNIAVSGTCTGPGCGGGSPGGTGTQIQYKNGSAFGGVPGSSTTATGPIFSSATVPLLGTTAIYNPANQGSWISGFSTQTITFGGSLPYVEGDIGSPPEVILNPPIIPSACYMGPYYTPTLGVMSGVGDPSHTAPMVVLGTNFLTATGLIAFGANSEEGLDFQGFYANASQYGNGDTFWQLPFPHTGGFWKADASHNLTEVSLTSSDMSALLSSTNTWTAQQTFTNPQPSTFTKLNATTLTVGSGGATIGSAIGGGNLTLPSGYLSVLPGQGIYFQGTYHTIMGADTPSVDASIAIPAITRTPVKNCERCQSPLPR